MERNITTGKSGNRDVGVGLVVADVQFTSSEPSRQSSSPSHIQVLSTHLLLAH